MEHVDTEIPTTPEPAEAAPVSAIVSQARQVLGLRVALAAVQGTLANARKEFEDSQAETIAALARLRVRLAEEELRLRDMAVAEHKATGAVKPGPGLGIRQVTVIEYNPADALQWAKEKDMALTLDVKAFEQIATATPLPFVTRRTEPQATIAIDLAKALT
jgi:hypothetical protein